MGPRMREDTEGGAKNDGEIPRHGFAAFGMMFEVGNGSREKMGPRMREDNGEWGRRMTGKHKTGAHEGPVSKVSRALGREEVGWRGCVTSSGEIVVLVERHGASLRSDPRGGE